MGQAKRRGTFEERKANPLGTDYRKSIGSRFHKRYKPADNSQGFGTSIVRPGISVLYHAAPRGAKGRRMVRHLNEKNVMLAQFASMNPEHQKKFTPRWRTQKRNIFNPIVLEGAVGLRGDVRLGEPSSPHFDL